MFLYKYTSREAMLNIVESHSLWARPLDGFNDPFECLPAYKDDYVEDLIISGLEKSENLKGIFQDISKVEEVFTSPAQLRTRLRTDAAYKKRVISNIRRVTKMTSLDIGMQARQKASTQFGLVCFSADPTNILMWSHYAEGHKGFVFCLDSDSEPWRIEKVTYAKNRIVFNGVDGPTEEQVKELATTKYELWIYESEYRLLTLSERWLIDKNGDRYDPLLFDKNQLKWICAGIMTPEPEISKLEQVLKTNHYPTTKVYRANPDQYTYAVQLPIELSPPSSAEKTGRSPV